MNRRISFRDLLTQKSPRSIWKFTILLLTIEFPWLFLLFPWLLTLHRIHKAFLYFVEDDRPDDQNENNKNAAPENIHDIETSGPQKGVAETFEYGRKRIHENEEPEFFG